MLRSSKYHPAPVHRDEAGFLIHAEYEGPAGLSLEQLWVRRVTSNRFILCCIPFFARNLALGDEVETGPAHGSRYVVRGVARRSGHFSYRVWLGGLSQDRADEVAADLLRTVRRMGGEFEIYSERLLAVDAGSETSAMLVVEYLETRERTGDLEWEAANTAE